MGVDKRGMGFLLVVASVVFIIWSCKQYCIGEVSHINSSSSLLQVEIASGLRSLGGNDCEVVELDE